MSSGLSALAREEFSTEGRCYLNNAAVGVIPRSARNEMAIYLERAAYETRESWVAYQNHIDVVVRKSVSDLIGAKPEEIAFTQHATHGINLVAMGLDWRDGDNVIVPSEEFPANVYCWLSLAARGVAVRRVKSTNGRVLLDSIDAAVDGRTRLIAISAVQYLSGYRQDLDALSEYCRRKSIILCVDAIQAVGALKLDLSSCHVDFLAAGGHKWLMGPAGTGFLYCNARSLDLLRPPFVGPGSFAAPDGDAEFIPSLKPHAQRLEESVHNMVGLVGLGRAVQLQLQIGVEAIEERIQGLRKLVVEDLLSKGHQLLSPDETPIERSGIVLFRHDRLSSKVVAEHLTNRGVDVSVKGDFIRVSPAYHNDESDIERFSNSLPA